MVLVCKNPPKSILLAFNISGNVLGHSPHLSHSKILCYKEFCFFLIKEYGDSTLSFHYSYLLSLVLKHFLYEPLSESQVP